MTRPRGDEPPLRLALALASLALVSAGPCGPIPGGALDGTLVTQPVADWTFVDDVPRCAVEVRVDDPHSVTVNCMSMDERLYVSCSICESKRWSGWAVSMPEGRIAIGERVYPVSFRRVLDDRELDRVWLARARKLGETEPGPRPDGWWTFELSSRQAGGSKNERPAPTGRASG